MSGETVADIGEFGLIDRLTAALPEHVRAGSSSIVRGIGDDAAVWQVERRGAQVITTDALIEGSHFRLDWTSWEDLGHKSLAVNLSDIAAMGADPVLAVVTLGLRGDERVSDLEAMYRGLGGLALRHNVTVAGGDIVKVPVQRLVSVTAIGLAPADGALLRSGARPGDVIGVTGTVGASAAGLSILQHPERFRDSTTAPALIRAHLRPEPRVEAGQLLAEHGVRAAMDVSDGLAGDLPKILGASGVSALIDETAIPVIAAVRALFPDRYLELALRGGEDYELLFTARPDDFAAVAREAGTQDITVTAIGEIHPVDGTEPELRIRRGSGAIERLRPRAFDHFG